MRIFRALVIRTVIQQKSARQINRILLLFYTRIENGTSCGKKKHTQKNLANSPTTQSILPALFCVLFSLLPSFRPSSLLLPQQFVRFFVFKWPFHTHLIKTGEFAPCTMGMENVASYGYIVHLATLYRIKQYRTVNATKIFIVTSTTM